MNPPTRIWLRRALPSALCVLSSCVYTHVTLPLSYRAPTPADVTGTLGEVVEGKACARAVLYTVAWGDGGYAAAIADAKAKSGATLLADVQSDTEGFNILAVYQKRCTVVHGRKVVPAAAP
jgi:hypothetical protein